MAFTWPPLPSLTLPRRAGRAIDAIHPRGTKLVGIPNHPRWGQSSWLALPTDASAGLEDRTKADTELRFFKLQARAKAQAAVRVGGAVRTAETVRIMARLTAGECGIDMGGLRAEGEALASKIAELLMEYRQHCEAHEVGRRHLWADLQASDAVNDEGTGNPASPLDWGHEGGKRFNPFWIEVDSLPVPLIEGHRATAVQKRVEWVVGHGEELAAKHASI